jgi:hypothetical protein
VGCATVLWKARRQMPGFSGRHELGGRAALGQGGHEVSAYVDLDGLAIRPYAQSVVEHVQIEAPDEEGL